MKRWLHLIAMMFPMLFLIACAAMDTKDPLAYQSEKLTIDAVFTLNDAQYPATLTLEAAEYDENGRMLARNAVMTLRENSILSGVSFSVTGTKAYIASDDLKIPLPEEGVGGMLDIVSLFCIDGGSFYETKRVEGLEKSIFVSGENRVEVHLNPESGLPVRIIAEIDGRSIGADIENIVVTNGDEQSLK